MNDDDECGATRWNAWKRQSKYSEKTCLSAALSTTNPILPDPRFSWKRVLHPHSFTDFFLFMPFISILRNSIYNFIDVLLICDFKKPILLSSNIL
jgi:hypothetical protein